MRRPTWQGLRDGILFFFGLAGIAFETLVRRPPDYGLLPVFASFCGLPVFIRRDERYDTKRGKHAQGRSPVEPEASGGVDPVDPIAYGEGD